jgi:hypothetical protein
MSESAALAFKAFIKASDKFSEITDVQIETNMSAHAPDFKPLVKIEEVAEKQPDEDEVMTAEEVKL